MDRDSMECEDVLGGTCADIVSDDVFREELLHLFNLPSAQWVSLQDLDKRGRIRDCFTRYASQLTTPMSVHLADVFVCWLSNPERAPDQAESRLVLSYCDRVFWSTVAAVNYRAITYRSAHGRGA